ncbi:chalcone isomerase family protein [uncultured Rhodoferax sp.]|uniref:chalcone isomerase family protein n=1 Tax=uncultured Rhodoferax sp. TaxID=223188 RepID=UPI0025DFB8D4|nr:chalcone isomerase family protein [uncultured Rhodoferax sp.]
MTPMSRRACAALLGTALSGLALQMPAQAQSTVSSTFPPTQVVQGTTLSVNGMGTRYRAIFKVYDLALYTPAKVSTPEALLAQPGPKRLNFVALRDVPGTDLGLAFIKGLNSNSAPELVQKHTASSTRLIEIFSGRSKLASGDTFAMEYVPGKGTTFFIQGQPQGAPVGDAEFFSMVLKIWVGPVPADFKLKDALLGL